MDSRIAIVIPVHGALQKLEQCLSSLAATGAARLADVVICDDATPGGLGSIPDKYAVTHVITRSNRGGFSIAINELFEFVFGSYDACILVHSDMRMLDGSLEKLLARWESSDKIGIIGGMEVAADDPDRIVCGGSRPVAENGQLTNILDLDREGRISAGDWLEAERVQWIPWGLVSRDCFIKVGPTDTTLANYFSDADLCYRANLAGFEVWYEPDYRVIHDRHTTTQLHRINGLMFFQADRERFCLKWLPQIFPRRRDERAWTGFMNEQSARWRPRLIPHLEKGAPIPAEVRERLLENSDVRHDVEALQQSPAEPEKQAAPFRRLYLKGLAFADIPSSAENRSKVFLQDVPVTVISPHCDDAALSVGGLLLAHREGPARASIVTLFGESAYAVGALSGLHQAAIMWTRQFEEASYAAMIGADYKVHRIPDRLVRKPAAPIFLADLADTEVEYVPEIVKIILQLAFEGEPGVLMVPLAAGLMADHVLVATAVALMIGRGFPASRVLVYDDIPYVQAPGSIQKGLELYSQFGLELTPRALDVTPWFEQKRELLSVYLSQMEPRHVESVEQHAQALAATQTTGGVEPWRRYERLWQVSRRDG